MNELNRDMSSANKAITKHVIPVLQTLDIFKDGKFICLENQCNDIGDMFDMVCGFDWFVDTQYGMKGIAIRCQQSTLNKDETFTLRHSRPNLSKTEVQKRIEAIEHNCIYPQYTIHAYLVDRWDSELDYIGIVDTKDMYMAVRDKKVSYNYLPANKDGTVGAYVKWQSLLDIGIAVQIIRKAI